MVDYFLERTETFESLFIFALLNHVLLELQWV